METPIWISLKIGDQQIQWLIVIVRIKIAIRETIFFSGKPYPIKTEYVYIYIYMHACIYIYTYINIIHAYIQVIPHSRDFGTSSRLDGGKHVFLEILLWISLLATWRTTPLIFGCSVNSLQPIFSARCNGISGTCSIAVGRLNFWWIITTAVWHDSKCTWVMSYPVPQYQFYPYSIYMYIPIVTQSFFCLTQDVPDVPIIFFMFVQILHFLVIFAFTSTWPGSRSFVAASTVPKLS